MKWVPFSADGQLRRKSCECGGASVDALGPRAGSIAAGRALCAVSGFVK